MSALPSPSQVARSHGAIYEGFYQQIDPAGTDCIAAVEAAAFLKRSGIPDAVLSKIWDMSDPQGKGFLDKKGFFVALKLIAVSQNGNDLTMANLALDCPPPQMKVLSGRNSPTVDWTIKPSERKKYEEMFYSLSPVNGKLPGDKVKPVMLNSKLPVDVLGKVWDLSDTDQDGFLSKEEFILAMHLIYKALENTPVPSVLPPELATLLRKKSSIVGGVPVLPDILPPSIEGSTTGRIRRSSTPSSDYGGHNQPWIVNAVDKAKSDELFHTLDTDVDGYVTGADVKDTFLQSGLPQTVLALIWNLCDIKQNGKLNPEQFALAMHFVQQKLRGMEIPATSFPEMIPPTLRPKPAGEIQQDGAPLMISGESETTGSKELDMIGGEIKEIQMEKMALEKDLAQKEADVKIKNGELKNCQNELDALETMLKQLELQKGEARKRLNDLDNQIEMLKKQKEEQKVNLVAQEDELTTKRQELSSMKQEEEKLETQIRENKVNLDALTNNLQNTQLQISQLKLKIDEVNEQYQLMVDGIKKMDSALMNGDSSIVQDFILNGISPIHEMNFNSFAPAGDAAKIHAEANGPVIDDFQDDPFKNKDPFKEMNGFASDPFADEDPFKSDPFKGGGISATEDPFASSDPFNEPFNAPPSEAKVDPFQGSDPFDSFGAPPKPTNDPFDPFGLSSNTSQLPTTNESDDVDPFGADPFGSHPVAPPRPASPTPALPPKKSKAPPPRPAPPKIGSSGAKPAPTRAAPAPPVPPAPDPFKVAEAEAVKASQGVTDLFSEANTKQDPFDPFGSSGTSGVQDDFANFDNFADFDSVK